MDSDWINSYRPTESSDNGIVCNLCKKTFCNQNALHNHERFEHISDSSDSDSDIMISQLATDPNDCAIRFIPHVPEENGIEPGKTNPLDDGYMSWVVIKVDADFTYNAKENVTELRRSRSQSQNMSDELKTIRGPFKCSYASTLDSSQQCNRVFYDCCIFSLHFREEHTKRRKAALRCQVCEKRLDRDFHGPPLQVLQGATKQPLEICTFSCQPCGLVFHDGAHYDDHNRVAHAKLKPYQCPTCSKRFTQQGGLQQHVRAHSGVRPFACTFCPKAFTQKAGLDQHLRTHTKIKPFRCVICSKCFSQSVHLRQHMRTHTNIQPFECATCGRKFKQSSHLTFHMRSHSRSPEPCSSSSSHNEQMMPEVMGMSLQQVEHNGALYYSAKLSQSMATDTEMGNSAGPDVAILPTGTHAEQHRRFA